MSPIEEVVTDVVLVDLATGIFFAFLFNEMDANQITRFVVRLF